MRGYFSFVILPPSSLANTRAKRKLAGKSSGRSRFIMRRYLLGVVLAALGGNAGAAWERVGVADDGMVVYADRSTIQKSGDGVKMQALLDYKVAEKDDSGKLFLSVKLLHEYDCKGERGRTLYYSLHAGQMGAGQLVYSEMRTSSEWRPAGRAIIGETLWNFACKKK